MTTSDRAAASQGQDTPQGIRRSPGAATPGRVRNSDYWPGNVRLGVWAWLLHRITGLALLFYLLLHILVISSVLVGGGTFDTVLAALTSPLFLVLDLFLTLAVLYHGLNGIRLLLFDFGTVVKYHAGLWWGVVAITLVAWAWTWVRLWPYITRTGS